MKTRQETKLLEILKQVEARIKYTHKTSYDGRKGTAVLMLINKKYYTGSAYVSNKDIFDKKIGRSIALGRAYKNYKDKKSYDPPKEWKFKEE